MFSIPPPFLVSTDLEGEKFLASGVPLSLIVFLLDQKSSTKRLLADKFLAFERSQMQLRFSIFQKPKKKLFLMVSRGTPNAGAGNTVFKIHSKSRIWILAFFINFCPIKTYLSGSQIDNFWHFWWTFVHLKCKRSSLRSQCWILRNYLFNASFGTKRLFLPSFVAFKGSVWLLCRHTFMFSSWSFWRASFMAGVRGHNHHHLSLWSS